MRDIVVYAELALCQVRAYRRMYRRRGISRNINLILVFFRVVVRLCYIVEYARDDRLVDGRAVLFGELRAAYCRAVNMLYSVVPQSVRIQSAHIIGIRIEQAVFIGICPHFARYKAIGLAERFIYLDPRRRNIQTVEVREFYLYLALFKRRRRRFADRMIRSVDNVKSDEGFEPVYIMPLAKPSNLLAPHYPIQRAAELFCVVRGGIHAVTDALFVHFVTTDFGLVRRKDFFAKPQTRRRVARARFERRYERRYDNDLVKPLFEVFDYIDMSVMRRVEAPAEYRGLKNFILHK